jgi:hypothetical protein
MKWKLVASFLFITSSKGLHAQGNTFIVNPGQEIQLVVPDSVSYTYPGFKNGTVLFKDGRKVHALFNYNALFEELMFITAGGDTLALDNGPIIQYVSVGSDTFYYSNSFLKNVGTYHNTRLASKELFVIVDVNAIGAMGSRAPSSVTTVGTLMTRGDATKLTIQEVMKIRKETQFFLGDKFNHYKLINKKSLHDFFPGKSKKIKEYLRDQPVNFNNKEDLVRLISSLEST